MTGVDTNVLVRYLTQDEARQSTAAADFLETECSGETPGFLNDVVLCELVWVLEDAYGYTRAQIVPVLEQLMRTAQLRVADASSAWRAIESYRQGYDFADALIGETNRRQGCDVTVTFDRRAGKLPAFRILNP